MSNLLRLNLQHFAELDLEAFRQEFESEFKEPEQPEMTEQLEETELSEVEQTELDPVEQDVEVETEEAEDEQVPEVTEDEPQPEPEPKKQTREENAAFAEMRRQNEALQKQAALVEKAAARANMTVDQYLAAVEEAELNERAEKQGIPAEFLRRQEMMERQLEQMTVQSSQSQYFTEVATVKSKYGMTDDEEKGVFNYIAERGLFDPKTRTPIIPFEDAYKLANFDTVQERRIREAKQKDLAAKKARQSKTAIPHTNASTASNSTVEDEITDDFVQERLKRLNLL